MSHATEISPGITSNYYINIMCQIEDKHLSILLKVAPFPGADVKSFCCGKGRKGFLSQGQIQQAAGYGSVF